MNIFEMIFGKTPNLLKKKYRVIVEERTGCATGRIIPIYVVQSRASYEYRWWFVDSALSLDEAKGVIEMERNPNPKPVTVVYEVEE